MDESIRKAMHEAGWHGNFRVSQTERIAYRAGMRAAAEIAEDLWQGGQRDDRGEARDRALIEAGVDIRSAADELEQP
jgi:hypothetical protein